MKNIAKFLFLLLLCAAIVVGCKKDETCTQKTPAERLAGRYTVYDTLFYEEMAGTPCNGGANEIKQYTVDVRALNHKRVSFSQLCSSDECTGDIYDTEIKVVPVHSSITKIMTYQEGNRIKIYYNWNSPCWPSGRAVMVREE